MVWVCSAVATAALMIARGDPPSAMLRFVCKVRTVRSPRSAPAATQLLVRLAIARQFWRSQAEFVVSSVRKAAFGCAGALAGVLGAWGVARRLREPPPGPLFQDRLTASAARGVAIAPLEQALTLARVERGGTIRVVRVESYRDGVVSGVDLSGAFPGSPADPIDLFGAVGYDAIARAEGASMTISATDLITPFDGLSTNIAMGVNYPAHGEEVALEEPFLFPKLSGPTPSRGSVHAGDGLLDYEVELGFVVLAPIAPGERPRHVGLVLTGDYTDRATLLREIDILDIQSGKGLASAKSRPGFLPIGDLLVIPADVRAFYKGLRLELYVNGTRRQLAEPATLTWDLDRMLDEVFERQGSTWVVKGVETGLAIRSHVIPARVIILSGTPDGSVFRRPTPRQLFLGVMETVFFLHWTDLAHLFDPTIREAREGKRYLQPGDIVHKQADFLGIIENTVVP